MLRVRYERLKRGWTQAQVAIKAGTAAQYISQIESGRIAGVRTGRVLWALSQLYRVHPLRLLEPVPDGRLPSGRRARRQVKPRKRARGRTVRR